MCIKVQVLVLSRSVGLSNSHKKLKTFIIIVLGVHFNLRINISYKMHVHYKSHYRLSNMLFTKRFAFANPRMPRFNLLVFFLVYIPKT